MFSRTEKTEDALGQIGCESEVREVIPMSSSCQYFVSSAVEQ